MDEILMMAHMMSATDLVDQIRKNLEYTCYEDNAALEALLESLVAGCNIAMLKMKSLLQQNGR